MDQEDVEREATEHLPSQLLWLRELERRHDARGYWNLATPGSPLAADDEALRPFQLSHFIGHCLVSSVDAMRTVRLVMQEHEGDTRFRLPLMGLYPLLRAAGEAGALAIWLLQPNDPRERRLRALQARMEDVLHQAAGDRTLFGDALTDDKAGVAYKQAALRASTRLTRTRKADLRAIAKREGIEDHEFERGHPGFGPIVGEAAASVGMKANVTRSTWHLLSGLSHPGVSRAAAFSRMEELGERDGVIRAHWTARPSIVGQAIANAGMMHCVALDLCAERGGDPTVAFTGAAPAPK